MTTPETERRTMAGRTLRTSDDHIIGTVDAVEGLAMLACHEDRRIYVPLAAVRSVDGDNITLDVARRDLQSQPWDRMPSEAMDTVATATAISTDDVGIAESPGLDDSRDITPLPFAKPDTESPTD